MLRPARKASLPPCPRVWAESLGHPHRRQVRPPLLSLRPWPPLGAPHSDRPGASASGLAAPKSLAPRRLGCNLLLGVGRCQLPGCGVALLPRWGGPSPGRSRQAEVPRCTDPASPPPGGPWRVAFLLCFILSPLVSDPWPQLPRCPHLSRFPQRPREAGITPILQMRKLRLVN